MPVPVIGSIESGVDGAKDRRGPRCNAHPSLAPFPGVTRHHTGLTEHKATISPKGQEGDRQETQSIATPSESFPDVEQTV